MTNTTDETITAGKLTLHRTRCGTVWFINTRGNKRQMYGQEASDLFEAIKNGSGELLPIVCHEGTQPATNLNDGRAGNSYANPNNHRIGGAGGNPFFPHGNWK